MFKIISPNLNIISKFITPGQNKSLYLCMYECMHLCNHPPVKTQKAALPVEYGPLTCHRSCSLTSEAQSGDNLSLCHYHGVLATNINLSHNYVTLNLFPDIDVF
jgi:hypothetical protein